MKIIMIVFQNHMSEQTVSIGRNQFYYGAALTYNILLHLTSTSPSSPLFSPLTHSSVWSSCINTKLLANSCMHLEIAALL
jgi:hypothetical protein